MIKKVKLTEVKSLKSDTIALYNKVLDTEMTEIKKELKQLKFGEIQVDVADAVVKSVLDQLEDKPHLDLHMSQVMSNKMTLPNIEHIKKIVKQIIISPVKH